MKVLVLNCGSSSVKFLIYDMDGEIKCAKGVVERVGQNDAAYSFTDFERSDEGNLEGNPDHENAIKKIITFLKDFEIIKESSEIQGVGHRVVHGGEKYTSSVKIDDDVCAAIKEISNLAPLHNPHNLAGIEIARKLLPQAEQVAVFDTAFHQTMKPEAFLYALPYDFYTQYKVRRYGFHGTSHLYISRRIVEATNTPIQGTKIISAHLGNGCSISAIKDGKVIETSMGMTPIEGLIMGTRCGDIDAGIIALLIKEGGLSADPDADNYFDRILNKKSGLLGISGVSNDMREIQEKMKNGNDRAELAFRITARRLRKYIGAYVGLLGGVDFLVFTAGIGENSSEMREAATKGLDCMGLILDRGKNREAQGEACISTDNSPGQIWILPTKEELYIARDTKRIIQQK
ncbi:acetate/propionate family kinase [Planctomycetota bacterium]